MGRLQMWAAGAQSRWVSVILGTLKKVWNMLQNHLTRGWDCWGIYAPAPIPDVEGCPCRYSPANSMVLGKAHIE